METTLRENNSLNSPAQIYNIDETGIPLDLKTPNVVAKTGTKKVRYRSTGRKGQITLVACANAAGQVLPPTVLPPTVLVDAKKESIPCLEIPGTMQLWLQ